VRGESPGARRGEARDGRPGWTSNATRAVVYSAVAATRSGSRRRIIGTATEKGGVLAFVLEGIHPHDMGTILDQEGIAIRTGHIEQ